MTRRPVIGFMLGWRTRRPDLMRAFTLAAAYYGADLYHFRTENVGEKTIKGTHLVDNQWVDAEFPYPDVIYDSTRRRGIDPYEEAYRKLEGIPMGHTLPGRSIGKLLGYRLLRRNEELRPNLIPYQRMRDAENVMAFLEKHRQVIFKRDGGYTGIGSLTAELKDDTIELFDQKYLHRFTREQMPGIIDMLISKKYLVQKLIHSNTPHGFPFHIRVHTSKNGHQEWTVAFKNPMLSLKPHVKVTNSDDTFRGTSTWRDFLNQQFGEKERGRMDKRIDDFALKVSRHLDEAIGGGFHEVGVDIGIDNNDKIWLFEAGIGLPRTSFFYMQLALPAVSYTLSLLNQPTTDAPAQPE